MSTNTISPGKKATSYIPTGMSVITPHLVCAGASDAIEFYKKAFNAQEVSRVAGPDGKLMNADIVIEGSHIMLVDEMPDWGMLGPIALKGSPVTIHVYVKDVDAVYAQAVAAGAEAVMPVDDAFWGDRYGVLKDPFGHSWSLATHVRDLTQAEIQEAAASACCGEGACGAN